MSKKKGSLDNKLPSLRKRYIIQTLFLGFLTIAAVLVFFVNIVNMKQEVTDELSIINKKLEQHDHIKNNLVEIFRNLELFILDPTSGNYADKTHNWVNDSIRASINMQKMVRDEKLELKNAVEDLKAKFIQLESSISYLINIRMDVNQQYPALAIAANVMTSPQESVGNNLKIMIDEIESGDFEPQTEGLKYKLLKTYSIWVNMIAQARIYYTNRFASFSSEILISQAESLSNLHKQFHDNIEELKSIYAKEDSFEGEINLKNITNDVTFWIEQFQKVRELSESEQWRTDSYLMKTSILPQIDLVFEILSRIESELHQQDLAIQKRLNKTTTTLFTLLTVIILLFLVFISLILFSLEHMIFHPISSVSKALKSKAFHREAPQLGAGKTREIHDLIEAFQEMDKKVSQRQTELEHQALHDHLTGLPNRFLLNQRLEYQLLTSRRNESQFTLFFIDLDQFKDVNDSLGHSSGDLLLVEVSKRLLKRVRQTDTVARLGGDEFAILLPETSRLESENIANIITESINHPYLINQKTITIGSSIGIVTYPEDGKDTKTLLQHGDIAMYLAKRQRLSFSHYDDSADFYSQNRLTLINDLRKAIKNDNLELYFQPQVQVENNHVYGAEALLRWHHKKLGFIQPDKIVELAEYSGTIHQLTIWVLKKAIEQCRLWHQQGFEIIVSVNLSVQDLVNDKLCQQIEQLLHNNQLSGNFLTLEITENGMMENLSRSIEMLNSLNEMNINLSIDDFGTGFSSLAYLKQLPVNELKIDKSFVMEMDKDENDRFIVKSIIQLGHSLGLKVVAEGVETKNHLELTNDFGCDLIQGYLFGKPQAAEDFLNYLKNARLNK